MNTMAKLVELQALPLEHKVTYAKCKIKEWYEHYNGNVYVAYSGGKDSKVLLSIARSIYPNIKALFVNTGLESKYVIEHVKSTPNVDIIKPEMNFIQVIDEFGWPIVSKSVANSIRKIKADKTGTSKTTTLVLTGYTSKGHYAPRYMLPYKWRFLLNAPFKVSDKCCDIMKKKPVYKYEKENKVFGMTGELAQDSLLRQRVWLKQGCNAFNNKHPKSMPLSIWTEQDILQFIVNNNISIPSIYGKVVNVNGVFKCSGAHRTGCLYCGFGCHLEESDRFEQVKEENPKLYNFLMNVKGLKSVLEYIAENTGNFRQGELF